MRITADEIHKLVGGELVGKSDTFIEKVSGLQDADEKTLSFLSNVKYTPQISVTKASIVLVGLDVELPTNNIPTLIKTDIPYYAFCQVLATYFNPNKHPKGIDNNAFVHSNSDIGNDVYISNMAYISENANIGNNVKIYPQVFIGNDVEIGENTVLYPGVKVYAGCKIGKDCIIHANTVVGSDGFGHAPMPDGTYAKIPQVGNVVIEDDVELGANCAIDRATMGTTFIRKGVKMDNLIQIAHNVEIGEHTVMAGLTAVSGSTKLGKYCQIGGQAGFAGHITIADGVKIGAQSGISNDVKEPNTSWLGTPIAPIRDMLRAYNIFRRLGTWGDRVTKIEKQLKEKENDVR